MCSVTPSLFELVLVNQSNKNIEFYKTFIDEKKRYP